MQKLEENIAHLQRTVDELSDVVARQEATIATLNRRVELLMRAEAEREAMALGQTVAADKPPPHY